MCKKYNKIKKKASVRCVVHAVRCGSHIISVRFLKSVSWEIGNFLSCRPRLRYERPRVANSL